LGFLNYVNSSSSSPPAHHSLLSSLHIFDSCLFCAMEELLCIWEAEEDFTLVTYFPLCLFLFCCHWVFELTSVTKSSLHTCLSFFLVVFRLLSSIP
jgi:hypothetical protein